jgi:isopenicillin N synthase-like dioxygenase
LCKALNVVWQSRAQVRPSADTPDQRASYQITRRHMESLWPTEAELVDFQQTIQVFEGRCWHVAMQVLSCFAQKLNFAVGFFTRAHDPARPSYQSTLRRPHYFATPPEQQANHGLWRRGPHTDFDSLTLFFSARARAACRCALARK